MSKNQKFNEQVKRKLEELHKLKEAVKKTDNPEVKKRIEKPYDPRISK